MCQELYKALCILFLFYVILTIIQGGIYYYKFHFTDEETEAQKG